MGQAWTGPSGPGGAAVNEQGVPARATGHERRSPRDRGFTLIEVLIAFLIAAMAAVALMHTTTGAVTSSRVAGRYDEAVARAQSHLAALSASPLADSDRQGDEGGGFHWRVRVAMAGTTHAASQFRAIPRSAITLYRITVTISWTEGERSRAVQLDSARLGPIA